jgi:hypothetical protein
MSPVQEKFEVIMRQLGEFLAAEDFRRSGRCFHKRLPGGCIRWSICSQKSRHSTAQQIDFTFNIDAEWKHRPARCEEWETRTTWYTGVGSRIGFLMPEKQDTWWTVNQGTSADFLSDQISAMLASCILPFFRQFPTEEAITQYLRARENDTMRRNYPHAITMLEFDLREKKETPEIQKRIGRIRFLGKISGVDKAVIEATIERVLKAYGYDGPVPSHAPWWKPWA